MLTLTSLSIIPAFHRFLMNNSISRRCRDSSPSTSWCHDNPPLTCLLQGAPPTPDNTSHELRCHLCMYRHCVFVSLRQFVSRMHDIIRDTPHHSLLYEITVPLLVALEQCINSLKCKTLSYCKFTSIICCHMLSDFSYDVHPTATLTYNTSYQITILIMVLKQRYISSYT